MRWSRSATIPKRAPGPNPGGAEPNEVADGGAQMLRVLRRLRLNPLATAALICLAVVHVVAFVGPAVWTIPPDRIDPRNSLSLGSSAHPFGTDELGRDVLSRLLQGGQVTLLVGLAAMLAMVSLGFLIGTTAGFYRGWIGATLMRLTDSFMAVPKFFFLLVILTVLTSTPLTLVFVIGLISWTQVARVMYGETLRWAASEFVVAARSIGVSERRILLRHVAPQTTPPLIVAATLGVAQAILIESSVSYLGLGVQPPLASWGNMLQAAQSYMWTTPSLALYPGIAITFVVLAYYVIGDGLRAAVDPRLRV